MSIKEKIRTIPDFPKKGIMFRDITTLLKDADGFSEMIDAIAEKYKNEDFDVIAGLEARGFIIGSAVAYKLGKGFVPIRKKGKLPGETVSYSYELEYGTDSIEVHKDAVPRGSKVLIIDDLLATGGTALAGAHLIEQLGGEVAAIAFVINLPDIGGSKLLEKEGYRISWLCEFEGD